MGKLKNFWVACVRQPIHPWGVGCGLGVYSFVRSLLAKRWRHALLQLVVAVVALWAVTFCAMFACMVKLTAR